MGVKSGGKVIRVNFGSVFRDAGGRAEVDVILEEGATLGDLMRWLEESVGPEAAGRSREYQWRHGAGHVIAVVDGRPVYPGQWDTFPLAGGCLVHLVPPLAGG